MALQDDNQHLIERLEGVRDAAENGEPDRARELLEALEADGYASETIAEPLDRLDDLDAVAEWADGRLRELQAADNPFADMSFAFDDAFMDMENAGEVAEDDESELGELEQFGDGVDVDVLEGFDLDASSIELMDEVDELHSAEFEEIDELPDFGDEDDEEGAQVDVEEPEEKRGPLLSGKFNVPDPKSILARRKKNEKTEDDAEENLKDRTGEEPKEQQRQSRPFESGDSQIRYASEKEPAPPSHRLPRADVSGEMAVSPPDVDELDSSFGFAVTADQDDATPFSPAYESDGSEELEFDLGFENPETARASAQESSSDVSLAQSSASQVDDDDSAEGDESDPFGFDDDFDFDLGFENPETARTSEESSAEDEASSAEAPSEPGTREVNVDPAETSPGDGDEGSRDRLATPAASDQDDMFFELAEALAAESSAADAPYRGEPKLPSAGETNPFAHDAPTGTNHSAIESVVAAAQSNVATNLNAILLEARRLRLSGELEAAYDITKKILSRSDNPDAQALQDDLAEELVSKHIQVIGSLGQTPSLNVEMSDIAGLDLDHRAGFILSQIDSLSTYEDIIELSSMSRLETLSVLASLVEKELITG
jgi:hypothetical protein